MWEDVLRLNFREKLNLCAVSAIRFPARMPNTQTIPTHFKQKTVHKRPNEITLEFNRILDAHLEQLVFGEADTFLEIHDIAGLMNIHPTHLSNTIKQTTGKSPCDICNEKTINVAKNLLDNAELTIADIACKLTFEPTNFTKYFKRHSGKTPSEYRKQRQDQLAKF